MPRFMIERAGAGDSKDLCRLMKQTPMYGSISITLEREPDYFLAAGVQTEEPEVYLVRENEREDVVVSFSAGRRLVYVNGVKENIRYLGDLRIHPKYRSGVLLAKGFKYMKEHIMAPSKYAQTIVVEDNPQALDLLTSGRAGLPTYFPFGAYQSHMINLGRAKTKARSDITVRRANDSDIAPIQTFFDTEAPAKQFYPCYEFSRIVGSSYYFGIQIEDYFLALKHGEIVGITGVWDQKVFKQTRLVSYPWYLSAFRPIYNSINRLIGGHILPRAGSLLNYFYLHTILVRDNVPKIFESLVRAIYNEHANSGFQYFLVGLDRSDPLNESVKSYRKKIFCGRHFLVSYGEDPRPRLSSTPFYLEAARI